MSIVQPYLPGARVLDLFAGSGALGLEAVSRGAVRADLVEVSQPAPATRSRSIGPTPCGSSRSWSLTPTTSPSLTRRTATVSPPR
jgi:hypothetical protein